MIGLNHYQILSALLFAIGVFGVIGRRNLIVTLLSIEIMLNAANLSLIAFSRFVGNYDGQVAALFVIAVAASEVAIGLAIAVLLFRTRNAIEIDDLRLMKW